MMDFSLPSLPGHRADAPDSQAPYRVLFVCQGNIARSAAAEALARASCPAASGLEFSSAGTGAVVGHGVAREVAEELSGRGVEAPGHRARQLDHQILQDADLVLAMQEGHRRWILEEWPRAVSRTFLLRHAARLLPQAPEGSQGPAGPAGWLRAEGGRSVPQDEIEDPFRKGPEAAAVAVERIQEALEALLPRLLDWRRGS